MYPSQRILALAELLHRTNIPIPTTLIEEAARLNISLARFLTPEEKTKPTKESPDVSES